MKKVPIIFCILVMVLSACSGKRTGKAIAELNQNSTVPLPMAMPESELTDVSDYERMEGFGCYTLENEDLSITFSGYPDVLDAYHVTEYRIKSDEYHLFGLQTGCDLTDADQIMAEYGYSLTEENDWQHCYEKNGVQIVLEVADRQVSGFSVYVDTANHENVQF